MPLVRTPEEVAEAKATMIAEYKALPDKSAFGDDNRAAERLLTQTFEKIERGDDLYNLEDDLCDLRDLSSAMDYITGASLHALYWALGQEELDE